MSDTNSKLGADFDGTDALIGKDDTPFPIKVEEHATFATPRGIVPMNDIVQALAEPQTILMARSMEAMGRLIKIDGSATVVRNGVVVTLNVGDAILKDRVIGRRLVDS